MKLFSNKALTEAFNKAKHDGMVSMAKEFINGNKRADLVEKIYREQLERLKKDIGNWRESVLLAEDIENPLRETLMAYYKDAVDDYQVFSAMQIRTEQAKSGTFKLVNDMGDVDERVTALFIDPTGYPLPWFADFLDLAIKSKFYGMEYIQLNEIMDGTFSGVTAIPEENIVPIQDKVLLDSRMGNVLSNSVIITDKPWSEWIVPVGSKKDLGLLNKCMPFVIYKSVFGAWSQHADVFGMPLRIGRTDLRDPERRANMAQMLSEMSGATYGIFDPDDKIEFVDGKSSTDPHNIYSQLIDKSDAAISKIILSQTGTTDEKSYSGSANVHMDIFQKLIYSDKLFLSRLVHQELIPRMYKLGLISSKKYYGQWTFDEDISVKDWADIISKLSGKFSISPEEVEAKIGLKVISEAPVSEKVANRYGVKFE